MAFSSFGDSSGQQIDWRQPGAKRKKLAGYLKAANELRQSYFGTEESFGSGHDDGADSVFPDGAVARKGNEEMIIFPSYARKHIKHAVVGPRPGESEQDYWQREWTRNESDNAVVDVDVRGWLFVPHRGPNTRRHRLVIGLAKQMSGLPQVSPPVSGRSSYREASSRATSPSRPSAEDEEAIAREAARLVQRGEADQHNARHGILGEDPANIDVGNDFSRNLSSSSDPRRPPMTRLGSTASSVEDLTSMNGPPRRESWQSGKMTATQLTAANERLLDRLRPFMANPLANTPVTAFFYNATTSRQHTIHTDPSGHFTLRAMLNFVPTHVRVFAGEKLSVTEEVKITGHHGVSLISDIDDTIKHSAISAGAREIFRNVFVRDLGDLTIEGVREWYSKMFDTGVQLHYVSNSPWQLFPVLTAFFKMAHLPPGSFHLKQYSGLFQGIFEPVAERKKSSLDKIFRDFPDRKFILVGDSGEADLEVYTETALEHPDSVLGIFIRDVTTPVRTGFFDAATPSTGVRNIHTRASGNVQNAGNLNVSKKINRPQDVRHDDADFQAAVAASLVDMERETRERKQSVLARHASTDFDDAAFVAQDRTAARQMTTDPLQEENLIDISDPEIPLPPSRRALAGTREGPSPPPPPKPNSLRATSSTTNVNSKGEKPAPPPPRKPSTVVKPAIFQSTQNPVQPSPLSQMTRQESVKQPPALPLRPKAYRESAKEKLANTYHVVPNKNDVPASTRSASTRTLGQNVTPTDYKNGIQDPIMEKPNPPLPPRRNMSGLTLGGARVGAANRINSRRADYSLPNSPGENGVSRKEQLWRQRWQQAQSILEPRGITLRTWRTGSDVEGVCLKLVETAMRDIKPKERK